VLLAEAKAALPAIEARAKAPATHGEIKLIIGAKFSTYPQPERNDGEWAMFWADYMAVLEDVPGSALEAAMDAIIRDPKIEFLPKPAKLREIAMMTENRAVRAFDRARQAIEHRPPAPDEPKVPLPELKLRGDRLEPSDADKERVRRQMREYIAQDDARKAREAAQRKADVPDTAGPADETGITAAMRVKIAKDRAA